VKRENGFPVIGVVDELGKLLGFASWGTFRAFPAYKYTVEHSIYIHHEHRGCGLSKVLMQALIQRAQQAQLHVLIGCIDATNQASRLKAQEKSCLQLQKLQKSDHHQALCKLRGLFFPIIHTI
ncbi:N-acetyltransferase family protein, partial [Klebsiella pneumoniae]|nr:N-acetyltransferase family protein [Klebsiella pneumoniae]